MTWNEENLRRRFEIIVNNFESKQGVLDKKVKANKLDPNIYDRERARYALAKTLFESDCLKAPEFLFLKLKGLEKSGFPDMQLSDRARIERLYRKEIADLIEELSLESR